MLCMLLWIGVGFAMKYLVATGRQPPLGDPDHAAPRFLLDHTPPWLAGIVLVGLCAAIMSTADAFLNLGAAIFVHDVPRAILGRSVRREVLWARISTVLVALAATGFALWAGDLVAILGIFSWGTFASALVPAVAIGFNWKRATWQAAAAAMATGLAVHLGLELLRRYPEGAPLYTLPYHADPGAASLMASLIVFIAVSFATPPAQLSDRLRAAMER
jgi:Na+/proline symporter